MPKAPQIYEARIEKLVHGGQGIGTLADGRKAFVWGVLPGETIKFAITKKRKDFVEGIVQDVEIGSSERVEPVDQSYLSTSPWQIMSQDVEDKYKQSILTETFARAGVNTSFDIKTDTTDNFYQYRNKMEYSFYGDESGLHLALYDRGTHRKQSVSGSSIAEPCIDKSATTILEILQKNNVRASSLKTLIIRSNQDGEVVAALFVRDLSFPELTELEMACKGIVVVYSNPKSPASVRTEDLYQYGDITLKEKITSSEIYYDVFSFFQVNIPVFRRVLSEISRMVGKYKAIDMYSGVGSIGLSITGVDTLIESDPSNISWAQQNTINRSDIQVIQAPSEKALQYIKDDKILIVDPPRAGLHRDLIDKINEIKPPKVVYLSCNPSTQARDISYLQESYILEELQYYNFFPRTPHIESLALLVRK